MDVLQLLESTSVTGDPYRMATEQAVEQFLNELEQALAEPWTLMRMAEATGLKRSRFAYYVRRLRNMSPIAYLAARRIERARRLLRERADLSVTEVAFDCGFNSSQYFATVFRRLTGHSPREERAVSVAASLSRTS